MIANGVSWTFKVTLVEAVFPALSVAVPLKVWPAPAVETVIGDGHIAVPESASVQVKVMVAGAVTTPPAPGAGVMAAEIVGAVSSIFRVVLALAVCPAASVAVVVMTWFAPSSVTVFAVGHWTGGTPPVHE